MTRVPDDLKGAVNQLERALREGPSPRVYAHLAEAYRRTGRADDAIRVAREGLVSFPRQLAIRLVLARSLVDIGDRDAATDVYRDILKDDPHNVEAGGYAGEPGDNGPGDLLTDQTETGSLSEELEHLAELFTDPSDNGESERQPDGIATLTLAEIYARQGMAEKAVEICETILERRPGDEQIMTRLAEYRRSLAAAD